MQIAVNKLLPEYQINSCTDELRKRHLVKSRAIRREFCARRRKDVDILDMLKEQEAILAEFVRAVKDVLMLRLAKINVVTTKLPTSYDLTNEGKHYRKIVENMGGEMVTITKVTIQAYFRTKVTEETSTVFYDVKFEWLPPSYWT